jgi:hypothetical protein
MVRLSVIPPVLQFPRLFCNYNEPLFFLVSCAVLAPVTTAELVSMDDDDDDAVRGDLALEQAD